MKTNADLKHSNKDMKIFLPIVVAFCAAVKTFKWKCKQSVAKLFMLHTVYTVGIKLVVDRPDCFYLSFLMMLLHTVVSSLLVNTCWTSTHSASSDPCIHYNADPDPRPYWAVTKLILKKKQYWFVSLLGSESASSTRIRIEEAFHNADPDSKHCSHYFYICSLNFYIYIFSHTNFSVWAGALILILHMMQCYIMQNYWYHLPQVL